QGGRLPDPRRHPRLVEPILLVEVEVAHFFVLGLAGGNRTQRRAAEERHLDVLREAVEGEEPTLALDSVEGRVPLDRLAHAGDGTPDQRVEAAPEVAFPARHRRDIRLHGSVAIALGDLRVATAQEPRLRGHPRTLAPGWGGLPAFGLDLAGHASDGL